MTIIEKILLGVKKRQESIIPHDVLLQLLYRSLQMLTFGKVSDLTKATQFVTLPYARKIHHMESVTPEVIFDLYKMLSNEQKTVFLKLLGSISTGEAPFVLVENLSLIERKRFSDLVFDEFSSLLSPILVQEAVKIAKENPDLDGNEFAEMLNKRVQASIKEFEIEISKLEAARLKRCRDRQSDPKIVKRNIEICNLRKSDSKEWTQGKLAKKFGLGSTSAIRRILQDKDKWHRLEAEMRTN